MFISFKNVASLFAISAETVASLREENASLKTANVLLEKELLSSQVNLDWLRVQWNQSQLERTALLEKLYGIRVPTPELARATSQSKAPSLEEFSFDDIGDEVARKMGLPVYGS